MARKIGTKATLNGKSVYWSGDNYGWQSKKSYNQLKEAGKFKAGAQTVDRILSSASRYIPKEIKDYGRAVQEGMARNEEQLSRGLQQTGAGQLVDRLRQQDATGDAIQGISDATNVDPRIIRGAATAAETVLEGRLGASAARRLAKQQKRITPATRQATGQGTPDKVGRLKRSAQRQQEKQGTGAIWLEDSAGMTPQEIQRARIREARSKQLLKEASETGQSVDYSSGEPRLAPRGAGKPKTQIKEPRGLPDRGELGVRNRADYTGDGDRQAPGNPAKPTAAERQRVREALARRDIGSQANIDDATRGVDVAAELSSGKGGTQRSGTGSNRAIDTVSGGSGLPNAAREFAEEIGFDINDSNSRINGYTIGQLTAGQGEATGAASRAMSKGAVQWIVNEYQTTNKASGAVFSSSRRKGKELLRRGTKEPGEKYIRQRYNELLQEINRQATNAGVGRRGRYVSPEDAAPTDGRVTRRQETPREKQQRIRRAAEKRKRDQPTLEDTQELLSSEADRVRNSPPFADPAGAFKGEPPKTKYPSTMQPDRYQTPAAAVRSDAGLAPSVERLLQQTPKRYEPPRRYSNESAERYQDRLKAAKRSARQQGERIKGEFESLTPEEQTEYLEVLKDVNRQLFNELTPKPQRKVKDKEGSLDPQFGKDGELEGRAIKGRLRGSRSRSQADRAQSVRRGTAKPRTTAEERELGRIRRRRNARRGR